MIIFLDIVASRCTHDAGFGHIVAGVGHVRISLEVKAMVDFNLKNLNAGLFNSQVSHLNIKTMEMDALNTLVDSVSETTLANFFNTLEVGESTKLMEFSEQVVKVNHSTRIVSKSVPEAAHRARSVQILIVTNNFRIVPWEG